MKIPSIVNVISTPVYISRPTPNSTWLPVESRYGYTYELPKLSSTTVEIPDSQVTRYRIPLVDNDSWAKVRRSGRIKMTPYTNLSFERIRNVVYLDKFDSEIQVARNTTNTAQGTGIATRSWGQAHVYTEEMLLAAPRLNDNLLDMTASAEVAAVRNELYEKASQTWDALTELAELKQGIELVHSLFRIRANALVEIIRKAGDKGLGLNDTAAIWLTFRYGLMPILYTWKDINEILEKVAKNPVFVTHRATRLIQPGPLHARPSFGHYAYQRGSIKVRGVVKKKYDAGDTAQLLMDMIGVNPIRTAVELIPLSFVLNWFINLGNVLGSFVSLDLATETRCCVSVKCDFTTEYYYRDVYTDKRTWPSASIVSPGQLQHSQVYDNTYPVGQDVVRSYVRNLHDINDVPWSIGVSDTWKHWLDALALSSRAITDVLVALARPTRR